MRQFFIIGHNPNTVSDAINYLLAGANALEPDVHAINGIYYMGDSLTSTDLTLVDYLAGLCSALNTTPALIPALIMFDTKDSTGNILNLLDCIQQNFADQYSETVITITRSQVTGDEHVFFAPGAAALGNRAFGIDEHTEPEVADSFFNAINVNNYTYADGISIQLPLLADIYKGRIQRAIAMRDTGNSFKLVYSWTLDLQSEIRTFLGLNPDGLITDSPASLKEILTNEFSDQYQLAQVGYNPFE